MKQLKVWVSILILFSLLLPAFFHADAARVAVIKEVKGEVYIKKGNGSREFKAKDGMSLSEGDSVRTVKKSSANIVYDDGSKTTVAPSSKLSISKLKDKDNGKQTKVKVVSGKVWNSVKSLSNANDEYDVETPTAVMGVRGTQFFVTMDPITGKATVSVLDGTVGVSQNSDSSGSSSGTSTGSGPSTQSEVLVTINQSLMAQSAQQPIPEAQTLDVKQLVQAVEPEVIVEIIQDLADNIKQTNQQAIEAQQMFELTEQQQMIEKALELAKTATALANLQDSVLREINQSQNKAEIDQLLQDRFNQTLENAMKENAQLKTETQSTQQQATNAAIQVGMTQEQIDSVGPQIVPTQPTSGGGNGGSGGGSNSPQRPNAPIISVTGPDGEELYIDVTEYSPLATQLTLYDATTKNRVAALNLVTLTGDARFVVEPDRKSYYMTQTINGVESLPSDIIIAEDPSPKILNAKIDNRRIILTFNKQLVPLTGHPPDDFRVIDTADDTIAIEVTSAAIDGERLIVETDTNINDLTKPIVSFSSYEHPIVDIDGKQLFTFEVNPYNNVGFELLPNGKFPINENKIVIGNNVSNFKLYFKPYLNGDLLSKENISHVEVFVEDNIIDDNLALQTENGLMYVTVDVENIFKDYSEQWLSFKVMSEGGSLIGTAEIFIKDKIAPAFANGTPEITNVGINYVMLDLEISETTPSLLYYVVMPAGKPELTAYEVYNAYYERPTDAILSSRRDISIDSKTELRIDDLPPGSTVDLYFAVADDRNNLSDVKKITVSTLEYMGPSIESYNWAPGSSIGDHQFTSSDTLIVTFNETLRTDENPEVVIGSAFSIGLGVSTSDITVETTDYRVFTIRYTGLYPIYIIYPQTVTINENTIYTENGVANIPINLTITDEPTSP